MTTPYIPKPDHPFRATGKSNKAKRAEYPSRQPAVSAEYQRRHVERLTNGSKARIQEALAQEAQTRRNIEALENNDEN